MNTPMNNTLFYILLELYCALFATAGTWPAAGVATSASCAVLIALLVMWMYYYFKNELPSTVWYLT